ncbi:MAG: hypothetical protein RSC76_07160 [Oscillospiraceae bacterium]
MKEWAEIKSAYVNGRGTQKELGEEYGVHPSTISKRASAGGWQEERKKRCGENAAAIADREGLMVVAEKIDRMERLSLLMDGAVAGLERAVEELDLDFQKGELLQTGMVDTGRLRQITASIKDLRDMSSASPKKADVSKIYSALQMRDEQ